MYILSFLFLLYITIILKIILYVKIFYGPSVSLQVMLKKSIFSHIFIHRDETLRLDSRTSSFATQQVTYLVWNFLIWMHTSTFINCIPGYAHTICAYFKYPPKVTFITSIQYLSTFIGRKSPFSIFFLFITTLFTFSWYWFIIHSNTSLC